jgi:MFS transporter, ACS family, tartrate transporter
MTGATALIALGYMGAALLPTPVGRVAGLALVLIAVQSFLVPFWCLPGMLLRGSAAAAGIAFVNSFGNVGGFAGPYLIGRLKDATGGTSGAFIVLAGVALVAAALCLVLRRQPAFASRVGGVASGPPIEARAVVRGRA